MCPSRHEKSWAWETSMRWFASGPSMNTTRPCSASRVAGDSSMKHDGMHQEKEGMASERADSAEEMAQKEREHAAEHHAERTDTP